MLFLNNAGELRSSCDPGPSEGPKAAKPVGSWNCISWDMKREEVELECIELRIAESDGSENIGSS